MLAAAAGIGLALYLMYLWLENQPPEYANCLRRCIEDVDPTGQLLSAGATLFGALPRSLVGPMTGARVTRMAGATYFTTLLSALSQRLGMGAGNLMRRNRSVPVKARSNRGVKTTQKTAIDSG